MTPVTLAPYIGVGITVILAIIASYAGVKSALAKQDAQREALLAAINDLRVTIEKDVRRLDTELLKIRERSERHANWLAVLMTERGFSDRVLKDQ